MIDTTELYFEIEVSASITQVWQAWTTREGIISFFAPDCVVDFRPGGAYEMLFNLEDAPGNRGGEGCVLLAIEPFNMISFTWNAPPEFTEVRKQRTHVIVRFYEMADNKTKVTLTQDGWGSGEEWQKVRAYFIRAWGEIVLPGLRERFIKGPIDWQRLDD